MKYHIVLIAVLIAILFLGSLLLHSYFAPCKIMPPYQLPIVSKDTLRIVFIGDSWAFLHKPHDKKASELLSNMLHHPVKFRSFGMCGLTSREIYEQMFSNDSLRHFLSEGCHYCVLSAGINDTYKKMSCDYYAKSMDAILAFFVSNDVKPLVLEIPDYDIAKCYSRQTITRKALRLLSMLVNRTPMDCKQMFREALDAILSHYKGKVFVLHYKEWNGNFIEDQQQLYLDDGLHLNATGYSILDRNIGLCLLKQINNSYYEK